MSGVTGNQDADIDLGQLMSAVWERRLRILATTILAGGIAFVIAGSMKPDYKAETRLLIETRENSVAGRETQNGADPLLDQYNIVSQAQIIQSADLIKQVIQDMKLNELKEFDPDAHSLLPNPLVALGMKSNPMDLASEERVLKSFKEKLQVYPVEGSRVIAIEFSSHDPALAAAVPNKMADVYLTMQSGAKLDNHTETTRWLEPEIESLRVKVQEAEKKVADYRSSAGLFRSSDNTSFSERQLNDVSTELARVRTERATAEARAENVRRALNAGSGYDTLADVMASPMIQRLKETEANLQAQIADLQISLMEAHPRLKGLRAQLAGIRQQIQTETRKILAAAESEAQVARLREDQLNAQMNKMKADSARAGEEEVGLRALEREAAAQRQLLESYLARYREAASRADRVSTPADARIVSTAMEPSEPYFPKVLPITIVVSLAVLVLQTLGIIIVALFSGRGLRPSGVLGYEQPQTIPVRSSAASTMPESRSVLADQEEAGTQPLVQSKNRTRLSLLKDKRDDEGGSRIAITGADIRDRLAKLRLPKSEENTPVKPLTSETAEQDDLPLVSQRGPFGMAHAKPVDAATSAPEAVNAEADEPETVRPAESQESDVAEKAAKAEQALASASANEEASSSDVHVEPEQLGGLSLEMVRDLFARSGVPLAITVSPTGDEGSTATVLLAREMAELGRSVAVIDMTGSACPSRLMCGNAQLPGITDLLCGTTAFGESIHPDRLSDAHIIPQGAADAVKAMRSADRLTMIFDALASAYDIVLVECGQADPRSLARLSQQNDAQILISLGDAQEETVAEQLAIYRAAGYPNVIAMTTDLSGKPRDTGRHAA
ncbi:exopolysaccharide transport family protein [Rhizobium helianthi]|uniref:Exopolysaccharide transport family protein n=1 Tax=Rhizobium helianthi TaxID=1132695 RepID=A0ABW4LXU3_9HYPH